MAGPTRIADHLRFQIRDYHPLRLRIPSDSPGFRDQRTVPVSLAATQGIAVAFFSSGYLDVSVLRVRPTCLCIQHAVIQESWDQRSFDNSPRLFAAFHALHRLLTPRHPPYALTCLTTKIHGQLTDHPDSNMVTIRNTLQRLATVGNSEEPPFVTRHCEKTQFRCHLDFFRLSKINSPVRFRRRSEKASGVLYRRLLGPSTVGIFFLKRFL